MPIYEFKCLKCDEFFEWLSMKMDEKNEVKCPKCGSENFERILSSTNYSMDNHSSTGKGPSAQTRTCSGGTCTTYDIPGSSR